MVGKRLVNTGGAAGAAGLDPLQNFETVTYTGNGGTQKITGYIRKGAAFNGSSSKILIGEFAGLNTSDYSVSLWFNHDSSDTSTNNRRLIQLNCSSGGDAGLFDMMFKQSTYEFTIRSGSASTNILTYTSNATELPDDTWNHIAVTRDNTTNLTTLYINGTNVKEQTQAEGSTFGSFSSIGCRTNGDLQVLGKIDQVRIFNTELDSTKVGQLAAEDYSDPKKSTTDYFGDGHGVALYELDDDASDTGDNYDGTPTNVNFLGMAFQPDWVWIKDRSADYQHQAYDSVRGATQKILPSSNIAESTDSTGLTAFDSNGFTISTNVGINTNNNDYVAWCWKAADTTTTISAGTVGNTIASDVRANQDAGFSIGTYTGNGTAGATVGHGLSSTPELIIVKLRSGLPPKAWTVYAEPLGNTKYLYLNSLNDAGTYNFWNDTSPTDSVFSVSSDTNVNSSSGNYVFYAFHSVDGYQRVGSYTGDSSTNRIIYTTDDGTSTGNGGFQPRWVMIKAYESSFTGTNWRIYDILRGDDLYLRANGDNTETSQSSFEFDSSVTNGFRITDNRGDLNQSGDKFLFLAIA